MFNINTNLETITNEHMKNNPTVAYQVAKLIFRHETMWEDWTYPIPMTCMEVQMEAQNASEVS